LRAIDIVSMWERLESFNPKKATILKFTLNIYIYTARAVQGAECHYGLHLSCAE